MNEPPRARGLTSRSSATRAIGLAISAISLVAVVWWASRQPAPTFPSSAQEWWALAGAVAVYGLATALRAERWLALLRHSSAPAPRSDAYALTVVGYMGNNVLPLRGGDVMRVYLMAPRAHTKMRNVIGTLVAERVLDLVVLVALFCVLTYGVLRGIDAPGGALTVATATIAVIALVAIAAVLIARRTPRGRSVLEFLRPMATATRELRGRYGARMTALTLVIWATEAAVYLLVGRTVGFAMSPIEAVYLIALASVFLLIPSGPGYVGTLDAAVLFGVRAIGGSGSQAVSFLLMLRFVLLVPITIVGLIVLVVRYGWRAARRPADIEAARL